MCHSVSVKYSKWTDKGQFVYIPYIMTGSIILNHLQVEVHCRLQVISLHCKAGQVLVGGVLQH